MLKCIYLAPLGELRKKYQSKFDADDLEHVWPEGYVALEDLQNHGNGNLGFDSVGGPDL